MIEATLQFPTIIEMIDFQLVVKPVLEQYDLKSMTVTGKFSHADIELAKVGFKAVILDAADKNCLLLLNLALYPYVRID